MTSGTVKPPAGVIYRNSTAEDIRQILILERLIFDDPWPESMFDEYLEMDDSLFLLAVEKNSVIGYAIVELAPEFGHLTNIAVHPDHRRKSVAQTLMSRIFGFVADAGRSIVVLEVRPSSIEALNLYRKWGFREMYRKPNYYRRPVEEAIIMAAYLDQQDSRN